VFATKAKNQLLAVGVRDTEHKFNRMGLGKEPLVQWNGVEKKRS
jgi:hypothetical protein